MEHQDWTEIAITNKRDPPKPKIAPPKNIVAKAIPAQNVIIADKDDNIKAVKTVSKNMAKMVIDARTSLNKTQQELAKSCNLDKKIIADIEKSGCVYNAEHINKISKVLGITIPRDFNT